MATEFSPFAPPTLGDAPAVSPPAPPVAPSVPTLAPPPPPSTAAAMPGPPTPAPPTPSLPAAPEEPAPPKRSLLPVLLLILVGIATIAGAVWFALATSDEESTSPTVAPPTSALGIDPQDVSSPVVEPIDDARDVVADIDANSEEAAALDLLGLDETGNEAADPSALLGYRFTWNSGTEATVTITVDATSGNYTLESGDGLEWRHVDGRSYGTRDGSTWAEVDAATIEQIERPGLDAPLTIDAVLDTTTSTYTATATEPRDDGTQLLTAEVDAFEYATAQPDAFATWMSLLGHPPTDGAVQPGEIVVVQAEIAADESTIDLLTVTTESFAASYSLDEVFDAAPVIEAPEL